MKLIQKENNNQQIWCKHFFFSKVILRKKLLRKIEKSHIILGIVFRGYIFFLETSETYANTCSTKLEQNLFIRRNFCRRIC